MVTKRKGTKGVVQEIFAAGRWHKVNEAIFKSWAGKRRQNGELYYGPRYYYRTDEVVPNSMLEKHDVDGSCEHTFQAETKPDPHRSRPKQIHPDKAILQRVNFTALEMNIPPDVVRAMLGMAYIMSVTFMEDKMSEQSMDALQRAYIGLFVELKDRLGLTEERLEKIIPFVWSQARDFIKDVAVGHVGLSSREMMEEVLQKAARR